MNLIDTEGLSHNITDKYLEALNLEGEIITDRLGTLCSLIEGSGVTVITGPKGRDYWCLVSPEVKVRIVPDDYEYGDRVNDELYWAAIQAGADRAFARQLTARTKPPTRGRPATVWPYVLANLQRLEGCRGITHPLVIEAIPSRIAKVGELDGIHELVALDWEWDRRDYSPDGLAFSLSTDNGYIPLRASDYDDTAASAALRGEFSRLLRRGVPAVFHNGRADIGTQYDGDPIELVGRPIDDTLVMGFLADPDSPDLGLKTLTPKYLRRDALPFPGDLRNYPVETARRYAAAGDTRNTYDLRRALVPALIDSGQWELYQEIERPLVPLVASMEKYGVEVDVDEVKREYRNHVAVEMGMVNAIKQGYGFDVRNRDGALAFMSSVVGHDVGTLDQRALAKYRNGEVDLYLYFTSTRTRRRNFLKRIIREAGRASRYRLYPRFNQAGVEHGLSFGRAPRTGRFSSSSPNLQNQPRALRNIYVPPVGSVWFKYDYSQLELRLAANASGDENLVSDLLGGDPHGDFQRYIQHLTGVDVGRVPAKTANFEKLYFGGDQQLVNILNKLRAFIDIETAREIGNAHAKRYATYYSYGADVSQSARTNGGARTNWGRWRAIPELASYDKERRSHGERAAINHTIQGWAADIVKKVMVMLVPVMRKYNAHLALQVHDEVDGWVPNDVDLRAFDREVRECMQSISVGPVPLLVDGGLGPNWASIKGAEDYDWWVQ